MKHISYYLIRNPAVLDLIEDGQLLITLNADIGFDYEAVKIEVWPVDLKISPCSRLLKYGKRTIERIPTITLEPKPEFQKRPNQKALFRFHQEG